MASDEVVTGGVVRLPSEAILPLLRAKAADVAARVLLVGDPDRARRAGALLDGAREVGANREYLTITGRHRGVAITVASHGVGASGAGVCFEELMRAGARVLVRAGTAGGLSPQVADGDLVVATAAVRDEGLTARLVPAEYPAVADPDLVLALRDHVRQAAETAHTTHGVHTGIVLTSDTFYPLPVLGQDLQRWQRAGCVATEMELSALFVLASLHAVRAGGVLAIDGSPLPTPEQAHDMSDYNPHRDVVLDAVSLTLTAALDALAATTL